MKKPAHVPLRIKTFLRRAGSPAALVTRIVTIGALLFVSPQLSADTTLWCIGKQDGASAEFTGGSNPSSYTIPDDWATHTAWPEWEGHSDGNWPAKEKGTWSLDCSINYSLDLVPANGCQFILKTLNASKHAPQLAVYSNGIMCGIIQMVGTDWFNVGDAGPSLVFGNTYKIYIPKEFLQSGANVLRIRKLPHPYALGDDDFAYLSFTYDFMRLDSLSAPATEPIHSRLTYLGVEDGGFGVTDLQVKSGPEWLKWAGVAYSGNPQRASFWHDLSPSLQPSRLPFLQMLQSMNMRVVMDYSSNLTDDHVSAGQLIPSDQAAISSFFKLYQSYFQYYELNNEPCQPFSKESLAATEAAATFINGIKPAWVKVLAPGYSYGGGSGSPVNWDQDAKNRAQLEALCQATNGHSYAGSYAGTKGGSFLETLKTYSTPMGNGLPIEFVTTEFGMGADQSSESDTTVNVKELGIDPTQANASVFDREVRAHLAFADASILYSAWQNSNFTLFTGDEADTTTWQSNPWNKYDSTGKNIITTYPDTNRLQLFRQYALAYATHGAPLPYTYVNASAVNGQLVYFRAVDTSTLSALPGSGATSNKILLNFVNFDRAPETMQVRVTMPVSGTYTGERFGPEAAYAQAHSTISLKADPNISLMVTLNPHEATQYILSRPAVPHAK